MSGLIIFGLLALLMLTGMPISIALGLTVLTFGGPEPVCGFGDLPSGADRNHQGLRSVDHGHVAVSGTGDLCAGCLLVAAQFIVQIKDR
jgi:hypothetical protein